MTYLKAAAVLLVLCTALGGSGPALADATATPQSPAETPPKAVPGWLVDIMPFVKEGKSFRLMSLSVPSGDVSLGVHNAARRIAQNVWHHGTAQLNVYKPGDYGFTIAIDLTKVSGFVSGCWTELSIGGSSVFEDKNVRFTDDYSEVNGHIELQPGNYDIAYDFGCNRADTPESFQKNGLYRVQILAPDDNVPRFFKPNELFTLRAN